MAKQQKSKRAAVPPAGADPPLPPEGKPGRLVVAWPSGISPERYPPLGSEKALQTAIEILDPPENLRDYTREVICLAVAVHGRGEQQAANAPIHADRRAKLRRFASRAAELRRMIGCDPGYLKGALYEASLPEETDPVWRDQPVPGAIRREFNHVVDQTFSGLGFLESLANEAVSRKGRSGRGNLYSRFYANPSATLVCDCGYIAWQIHPERVSGHTAGPFYQFVSAVYEYASGKLGDGAGAGIEKYVKHFGGVFRRRFELDKKLADEMISPDEYDRRCNELFAELGRFGEEP